VTEAVKQLVDRIQTLTERLSDEEADALAEQLSRKLAEIEEERQWAHTFASSEGQAALDMLIAEAEAEIAAGKVHDLDEIL
jgi:adenosylmethionine-8-amino-7-oxononanoate aminotransferase